MSDKWDLGPSSKGQVCDLLLDLCSLIYNKGLILTSSACEYQIRWYISKHIVNFKSWRNLYISYFLLSRKEIHNLPLVIAFITQMELLGHIAEHFYLT
jgi:hypothetical protein